MSHLVTKEIGFWSKPQKLVLHVKEISWSEQTFSVYKQYILLLKLQIEISQENDGIQGGHLKDLSVIGEKNTKRVLCEALIILYVLHRTYNVKGFPVTVCLKICYHTSS